MIKIKARNAGKTQSNRFAHGASLSRAIAKFRNAEIDRFGPKIIGHDLIIGSLTTSRSGVEEKPESQDTPYFPCPEVLRPNRLLLFDG